ncbi:MAG TPA: hypothetical protein DEP48_01040 [Persephonella sp.]|uniref:Uncharacterized protein n=1 Tax=Persephonella marina (strain DSM 14350 / EX-H1) TaxID=123214 RepID=C0QR77_PERMH|nr:MULTISPECIES: hypothetical protein [Persephonella]ACO03173.1 hypothetical protein PERMA_1405 [Persephonella marina EX-H1]HCB68920.1 hypothetical protein [Persephonella sp.]
MEILKKAVIFFSGVIVYLFIFSVTDYLIPGTFLSEHYSLTVALVIISGFCSNILINRFLYRLCIIRSILYSFYSLLLLTGTAFVLSLKEGV